MLITVKELNSQCKSLLCKISAMERCAEKISNLRAYFAQKKVNGL